MSEKAKSGRLQVRINQIDHTLTPPGVLDNSSLPQVPVLRIYGASSTGQTACVHVHQVYPYFFIEYSGKLKPRHVNHYISKLFRSLNHAVALSLKRNPLSPKSQFIRAIVLVKGIPFYGFHTDYAPFLKVLVADPTYVSRITTILQSGSVMGTRFRLYETHLSYILQFLSDFGLYGCGILDVEDALERCSDGREGEDETTLSRDSNIVHLAPSPYFRESRLPLEVDVIGPHILNRNSLQARTISHKSSEQSNHPHPLDPLVPSVRELWDDERKHRQELGLNPSPEIPVDLSDSSRTRRGDWVGEARWWDEIALRIEREKESITPKSDEKQHEWERFVMTTFESVEAVWEKQYKTWKPAKMQDQENGQENKIVHDVQPVEYSWDGNSGDANGEEEQVEVDISLLSDRDMSQLDQEENQGHFGQDTAHEPPNNDGNESEAEEDLGAGGHEVDDGVEVNEEQALPPESPENPFMEDSEVVVQIQDDYRLESPPTPTGTGRLQADREGSPTPTRPLTLDLDNEIVTNSLPIKDSVQVEESLEPATDYQQLDNAPEPMENDTDAEDVDRPALAINAEKRSTLITARAVQLSRAFDTCKTINTNRYFYAPPPPTLLNLKEQLRARGLPTKVYRAPFYSRDSDIPETSKEYAGIMYQLKGGKGIATLQEWSTSESMEGAKGSIETLLNPLGVGGWEYASHAPSVKEIRQSMGSLLKTGQTERDRQRSQIEGPTQANIYGFKTSPKGQINTAREKANMTIMSLEIFVPTQDGKAPDPEIDEVVAIFYAYRVAGMDISNSGVLIQNKPQIYQDRLRQMKVETLDDEVDLFNRVIDLVVDLDPDILTGWEVQLNSWGYLEARGNKCGLPMSDLVSRAPPRYSGSSSVDKWSLRKASTFKVAGRHVLNLWRIMRSERTLALTIYTFENAVFDVLRKRVPKYSYQTMTKWYDSPVAAHTSMLYQYLLMRVHTNLELLEEADIVTKTAEFARVFGVDFFSVISRGSQFKVESFMFRIAKPESFVLISPSRNEVGRQNAAECMPLIMEPASAFYTSPLLVLDFQSLYPSIMIAYNYCYSTCLGRIKEFKGKHKFGVIDELNIPPGLIQQFQGHITVAPNGMMYVKPNIRKGLLGRMLVELLDTRVMVKTAMKSLGNDKARKRILDARQLGLKYIANVTYGYTSASFSGRMPAVEIADSIVQSGRETLEKAIDVIDRTEKWSARVVYGDTDSVFVYLSGKSKEEAFSIGYEIADTITAMNPAPIKLKFEKVYLPCVLLAKKRYVGFKYESIDDIEPVFDAKGIETVRRDGVLAQRKMVENCLKMLFRTQNLSEVKDYCCRTWSKLLQNKASVQDFIFAKEVRMGTYSDKGPPPPGVVVAARHMVLDPNYEAQYGDRIPYVIARSTTAVRLVDRAIDPLEFMDNNHLHLDANYYILRVLIPPLERIFNLVGVDIRQWYNEMPRTAVPEIVSPRKPKATTSYGNPEKMNIGEHFLSTQCLSCGDPAYASLCDNCFASTEETITNLRFRIRDKEKSLVNAHRICVTCTGSSLADPIHCISLDCPWFYARRKAEAGTELIPLFEELLEELKLNADREPDFEEISEYHDLEYQSIYDSDDMVDGPI